LAKAYQWSTRIMIVALEMVLPGMAGYWLDQRLGTVALFMLIGLAIGCTAAIMHLIQMTSRRARCQVENSEDNLRR
jgi:F0F1-type ATP synthase assembly protein I